jgi:hypothetical protein
MNTPREWFKTRLRKSFERERFLEKPMESFSRMIWPYSEAKLVLLISIMPALDCASTYAALKLSGKNLSEAGPIGKWALTRVGFTGLFVIEMASVGFLILLAAGAKSMYGRLGFKGFGRAAWVFILAPSFVAILAAMLNNVIVTLM